ncbi:L-threonine-O-3-phosphate decarboxylase [Phyllobacterium sp. YR531]|nr:L-threonine-O-3-phosphate decarboxylase [Phyllobacterium sp. YR531]
MQIEHGGALDRAMMRFGGKPEDWMDLSTGINPELFPLSAIPPEIWNRLPDQKLLDTTVNAARQYYGVERDAGIVAAPGTQALIQILPQLAAVGEAVIISPTYQEHELSFKQAGWSVSHCQDVKEISQSAKVAVVVNPNNPDGRIVEAKILLDLAEELHARGGFLIVDEAFSDPHPETSIASHAGMDGLIILKSFGKFFGLGGLRLGFALTTHANAERLKTRLGPWAVSGPALFIAANAFSDSRSLADYRSRLTFRRKMLADVLVEAKLCEIGGTSLFSLVKFDQATALYDKLCEQHVLTRKFAYAPQWLRFGLPLDAKAADVLSKRIAKAFAAN